MLDPNALVPPLHVADHFRVQVWRQLAARRNGAAQEAHHVGAGEAGQAVLHQPGIQSRQAGAGAEQNVGGPFALIGGPVVVHGKAWNIATCCEFRRCAIPFSRSGQAARTCWSISHCARTGSSSLVKRLSRRR